MGAESVKDKVVRSARKYPCHQCPLMRLETFRRPKDAELDYLNSFKKGELTVDRGATIIAEGARSPHLYTILEGWAFRFKLLPDGRRQIVNFAVPGDLLGLQGALMEEMQHSVEALSPMTLCVFERSELINLFHAFPELGYDVTWLASREECMLDENLLSVGRRSAIERLAYLVAFITERAERVGLFNGTKTIPITQQHIADTLGLSLVHTNKTVRRLANQKLLRWRDRGCEVLDLESLKAIAGWEGEDVKARPYL